MLFWDKLVPQSPVYNVPIALATRGHIDQEALARSVELIISRHEVLRSLLVFDHGEPVAILRRQSQRSLTFMDLSDSPVSDVVTAMQETADAEARRPFHLGQDSMLRAALFRLSESNHLIVLTMHHIASDGWSVGVLLRELSQAYQGFARGTSSTLAPLRAQYTDFARWQRELLQGPASERCLSFWKRQLEGIDSDSELLPLDHARPTKQTFVGNTLRANLPASTLSQFAEIGQLRRATPFMVMLAGLQVLLHSYSGTDEVVVGVPIANRARPEFEPLIGCFINMVAIRSNVSGNPTFLELLARVRETALAALLHPEVPFSEVVRHLHPKRKANRTPWFQVQLVLQNYPMPDLQWPGLTLRPLAVDTGTSKFDLSVLVEMKQELEIAFEYNTDLFEASTMQRILREYTGILRRAVRQPDARLRDLSVGTAVC